MKYMTFCVERNMDMANNWELNSRLKRKVIFSM